MEVKEQLETWFKTGSMHDTVGNPNMAVVVILIICLTFLFISYWVNKFGRSGAAAGVGAFMFWVPFVILAIPVALSLKKKLKKE